jgi:hypothetical protein
MMLAASFRRVEICSDLPVLRGRDGYATIDVFVLFLSSAVRVGNNVQLSVSSPVSLVDL